MNSTFGRALIGFTALSSVIGFMAMIALWAIDTYIGGLWWASIIIVLFGLSMVTSVYMSTLHSPIQQWIRQPEQDRKQESIYDAVRTHERAYHA